MLFGRLVWVRRQSMYAGHLAAGLLIKSDTPKLKAWPILLGVGWMDILDGIFIILGANTVTPNLMPGHISFST
jgi:hypothetical protein